jgi:hypothetical protein
MARWIRGPEQPDEQVCGGKRESLGLSYVEDDEEWDEEAIEQLWCIVGDGQGLTRAEMLHELETNGIGFVKAELLKTEGSKQAMRRTLHLFQSMVLQLDRLLKKAEAQDILVSYT